MFFTPPVLHRKPVAGKSVLASYLADSLALAAGLLVFCSAAAFAQEVPGSPGVDTPRQGGGGVGIGINIDIGTIFNAIKDGKVASPVSIEVRFKPAAGKAIDSSSFKVYYGAFKLDVTSRLLKTAKITSAGFAIEKADIPAGSHRLVMRVSDDSGATGLRELKFTVEA